MFHISEPIMVQSDVDLHVMPLRNCEFREKIDSESHTLFKGVNEILPTLSMFFV
jgi:hypothetical protein